MFRMFLIGLVVAGCNNPPPPPGKAALTGGSVLYPPIVRDRQRIETRLRDHQDGIEAAFVAGDCATIALKRAAVEKRINYSPPLVSELMADELRVGHRRLDEYDRRAKELGCELEDCESFTDIAVKDATPQTVSGTTKSESPACYRVRNTLGGRLLSVKVSAKATVPGNLGVDIEPVNDIELDDPAVALEASPVAAFTVRSMEIGDDGIEPKGGWQTVSFTLTVTPVLRQPVAGQASTSLPQKK